MSVYFAIPSARPAAEAIPVLAQWSRMGYRVALLRQGKPLGASIEIATDCYLGWAASINYLCKYILQRDPEASWIVSGGDDTLPDPDHTADEIAAQCSEHFRKLHWPKCWHWPGGYTREGAIAAGLAEQKPQSLWSAELAEAAQTLGVMQPTGDLRAWPNSRIDTFAGSPWLGREWCWRAYGGKGPLYAGYHHCWADEELQAVAIQQGVFWQRPDLTHSHMHHLRERRPAPAYADMIGSDYGAGRPTFLERKAAGWPGSEPIV